MLHEAITVMPFTDEWQGRRNILPCPALCMCIENSLFEFLDILSIHIAHIKSEMHY